MRIEWSSLDFPHRLNASKDFDLFRLMSHKVRERIYIGMTCAAFNQVLQTSRLTPFRCNAFLHRICYRRPPLPGQRLAARRCPSRRHCHPHREALQPSTC